MTLVSLGYAAFVGVTLALYYALSRRGQNVLLLVASCAFCMAWSLQAAMALLGVTTFNFAWARQLRRERPGILWLGVGFNVFALVAFKYFLFFVPEALDLAARFGDRAGAALPILVPVGLSYYVLQGISYLVDVHQGQIQPSRSAIDFGLYMAYFPRLVSGPIERAGPFLARLGESRIVDNEVLARGVTLIVVGLVRKAVIADSLAAIVPRGPFRRPEQFSGPELVGWLAAVAVVVYNDFAGYTSMARGVSGLFGIELTRNFAQPFFARSFGDFWSRWHISLSLWLRDYVFMPVTRRFLRRADRPTSPAPLLLPALITMLVSGAWHGMTRGFLVWGLLSGFLLGASRMVAIRLPAALRARWVAPRPVRAALVFTTILLTLVPVVVLPGKEIAFWAGVGRWWGGPAVDWQLLSAAGALALVSLWIDWVQFRSDDEWVFLRWPRPVQSALLAVALVAILLSTHVVIAQPFVYQGF